MILKDVLTIIWRELNDLFKERSRERARRSHEVNNLLQLLLEGLRNTTAMRRRPGAAELEQLQEEIQNKLACGMDFARRENWELPKTLINGVRILEKEIRGLKEAPGGIEKNNRGKWALRCASLLAHILPNDAGEEWLGDLKEAHRKLLRDEYSTWAIVLITLGRMLLLGWCLFRVKLVDLVALTRKRRPM